MWSFFPVNAFLEAAGDASVDDFWKDISDGFLNLLGNSVLNISVGIFNSSIVFLFTWGITVTIALGINSTSVGARDWVAITVSTDIHRILGVVPLSTSWVCEVLQFGVAWLLDFISVGF
jgi:hypothetical protein